MRHVPSLHLVAPGGMSNSENDQYIWQKYLFGQLSTFFLVRTSIFVCPLRWSVNLKSFGPVHNSAHVSNSVSSHPKPTFHKWNGKLNEKTSKLLVG